MNHYLNVFFLHQAIPAPVSDIMNNIKSYFRTQDDKHIPSDDQLEVIYIISITLVIITTVCKEKDNPCESYNYRFK